MNVLLIGSGGREHALAWKLKQSKLDVRLYLAPGNPGMSGPRSDKLGEAVDLDVKNHDKVAKFCKEKHIRFVVIGPEAPLVAGLVDDLAAHGIDAFGPSKAAAQLEGSKVFTKELCSKHNIPTAAYKHFINAADAKSHAAAQNLPIVIKADGLAAGKGVTIAENQETANTAIEACFDGFFGAAGAEVVIEEFLEGEEASFFVLCDGEHILPLTSAQDHKRAENGDKGPNTGGMGAYSPAPIMTKKMTQRVMDEIITPTITALREAGTPYRGVLYAGLMITKDGPKLIEYNVRFGDPECQVLMMRLRSDLVPLLRATIEGKLQNLAAAFHPDCAMSVVMAAKGYPGTYETGSKIGGLDAAADNPNAHIFHAGTSRNAEGDVISAGGRVVTITARAKTLAMAKNEAYALVDKITWPEGFYRTDIGWRALETKS